mmetsp:Transcript_138232/g.441717  ORF Transcript_138232/g.441717 Transcript_138232/m.441717 type:complete len:419 (-) Transcript_138232:85-1341(-)
MSAASWTGRTWAGRRGVQATALASLLGISAAAASPAFVAASQSPDAEALRRLQAAPGGFSWALKLHEKCKTPIVTAEDCQHSAESMGLWHGAPQVDESGGENHDPPFCYMEYDDSRVAGILKFNPQGTNTGDCGKYDRCLCECRVGSAGQWILGNFAEPCTATCKRNGRRCTASAMQANNHDVDTQEGIAQVMQHLGHECKTFDTTFGASPDVPVFQLANGECFYSRPRRDEASFDCDAVPADADKSQKSRLCWCEEDQDEHDECPSGAFARLPVQAGAVASPCPMSVDGPPMAPQLPAPPLPVAQPPPAPVYFAQPCPVIGPRPTAAPPPTRPPSPPPPPPPAAAAPPRWPRPASPMEPPPPLHSSLVPATSPQTALPTRPPPQQQRPPPSAAAAASTAPKATPTAPPRGGPRRLRR